MVVQYCVITYNRKIKKKQLLLSQDLCRPDLSPTSITEMINPSLAFFLRGMGDYYLIILIFNVIFYLHLYIFQ